MTVPAVADVIVLRCVNYGEADRVVTVLARELGKLSALARAARKSQRRFAGLVPGARGEASLRERGGADLWTLERFEAAGAAGSLLDGDLARVAHGAYVLELCERLCAARAPEPRVFDYLAEMLRLLGGASPSAARLRVFELGLLARLGLAPVLERCVSCGRADLDAVQVELSAGAGGLLCRPCGARSALRPEVLRWLAILAATPLAAAAELELTPALNAACREAHLALIRAHTQGPLRSVEFVAKLEAAR